MQAFYYAMPALAVTVIAAYIFTSIKLHKFTSCLFGFNWMD
ncbi:hypothetical protein [Lactobacillus taiwanensis]|nr:hypothetical protein [Lactobacillus taiwanensis]MCR1903037.1 hypothetical protein [Lactobacillus taiwanensis]